MDLNRTALVIGLLVFVSGLLVFKCFFVNQATQFSGTVIGWEPAPEGAAPGVGPTGRISLANGNELLMRLPSHQKNLPIGTKVTLAVEPNSGTLSLLDSEI